MKPSLTNRFFKRLPYKDNFIRRLPSSTIGSGMLHEGNLYLMDYAIENMPEGEYVLEIGSWAGLSTNLLLYLMKKYKRKEIFMACDPWIYESLDGEESLFIDGREDISKIAYMDYIREAFVNSVSLFSSSNLPYTCRCNSDEFFKHLRDKLVLEDVFGRVFQPEGRITFCYIDGNHKYEFVKRDFENVSQFLMVEGMILLDDSFDGTKFGTAQLIKEIKRNPDFRIIKKNPNYLIKKLA